MSFVLPIIYLIIGFALLVYCADMFVDGASRLAEKMKIPQIVIGLTIVAFGTSAPEAAVSITAGMKGSADLAVANVLGSNILNVLIILGVTAIITPLAIKKNTIRIEIPFMIFITVVLGVLGYLGGTVNFWDGVILAVLMAAFMVYLVGVAKKSQTEETSDKKPEKLIITILKIVLGCAGIVVGADLAVKGATNIATLIGISERIIGLTVVALGTSLPELVTSVIAARKKNADIAIGNIVGSNIFNILFVLGITALVTKGGVVYQSKCIVDNVVALVSAIALFIFVLNKEQKLKRWGGVIFLVMYAAYFVYLMV